MKLKNYIVTDVSESARVYDAIFIHMMSNLDDITWITKEGKEILIKDMDTNHLKNAIAMLKNNGRYKDRSGKIRPIYRNMQEEYYSRLGPAGKVLFGKKSSKKKL